MLSINGRTEGENESISPTEYGGKGTEENQEKKERSLSPALAMSLGTVVPPGNDQSETDSEGEKGGPVDEWSIGDGMEEGRIGGSKGEDGPFWSTERRENFFSFLFFLFCRTENPDGREEKADSFWLMEMRERARVTLGTDGKG